MSKTKSVVQFVYSYPYEGALLKLQREKLTREHSEIMPQKVKGAQKIWDSIEKKVFEAFEDIYKIKITEKRIETFLTMAMYGSYSHPLTISIKHTPDIDKEFIHKKAFIYLTIHEFAHYFIYTRNRKTVAYKLFDKIRKADPLGVHKANLHILINTVEYAIGAGVYDEKQSQARLEMKLDRARSKKDPYYLANKFIKDNNIEFDRSVLDQLSKIFK